MVPMCLPGPGLGGGLGWSAPRHERGLGEPPPGAEAQQPGGAFTLWYGQRAPAPEPSVLLLGLVRVIFDARRGLDVRGACVHDLDSTRREAIPVGPTEMADAVAALAVAAACIRVGD